MEAEAREILTKVVHDERPEKGLATYIRSRMVSGGGQLEIPRRGDETERALPFQS
jgi:plasmid stability protein